MFVFALCLVLNENPKLLRVEPIPAKIREEWQLKPFYQKMIKANGFLILSSNKVSDAGLQEAARLINKMLSGREDVRQQLIRNKIRFCVMSVTEQTTDVPEHSDLTPKEYWDKRARGLGATLHRPTVSCGEENLLHQKGDRYPNENILIHEFAHAMHEVGLNDVDKTFDKRLQECFNSAKEKGLWAKTYAMTNHKEYWAETVQSYFDCNNPPNHDHNDINTREKLKKYDPAIYQLINETLKSNPYRYDGFQVHPAKTSK